MKKVYRNTIREDSNTWGKLNDFLSCLEKRVEYWSEYVYVLSNLENLDNRKLQLWKTAASDYLENGNIDDFIYTKYGYAVEEAVNLEFQSYTGDFQIDIQATHGSTRPDIVVSTRTGECLAWLDITSEGSTGHINKKSGSGWHQAPLVAEVLYKKLNLTSIKQSGDNSIAKRTKGVRVARQLHQQQDEFNQHMVRCVDKSIFNLLSKGLITLTRKDIANELTKKFKCSFQTNYTFPVIKSLFLEYCNQPDAAYTDFAHKIIRYFFQDDSQDKFAMEGYVKQSLKNVCLYKY